MTRWAIISGEYPPQPGGVSDYTRLVAEGLVASGDAVSVYAPPAPEASQTNGVLVNRMLDRFGPKSIDALDQLLRRTRRPDRILIQYVPHAFGWKAMNLPFARWLARDARRIAPLWVMFHEVAFPLRRWPPQHAVLGIVTHHMAAQIARRAARVFVSIPNWAAVLHRLAPTGIAPEWLPIPCTLDSAPEASAVDAIRRKLGASDPVVGHFGTYGPLITDLLTPTSELLLARTPATLLMIGRGSDAYREELVRRSPLLAGRVVATGELPPAGVSAHLQACDAVLQPYPDGVSSRRTSVMAALANGVPVITNLGPLSEPLWTRGGVSAASQPDPITVASRAAALLSDDSARRELGLRGQRLYHTTFALERTVAALRGTA